ncbi:MAG: hypothetical protein A2176_11340 [Spirochaetes bacterium RBG_13_51_14]|nr:MAG: hypothetical protein A2176_11340 [Spirochaetes bacterium RBG_13_51_14]
MNTSVEQFHQLLGRYKLSRPVSPGDQEYIINSRKQDLKDLLRKKGKYSLILWIVIAIYAGIRKFGIHITMVQSKIIAGMTAVAVVSGSSTGVYQGTKYVIKAISKPPAKVEEKIDEPDSGMTIPDRRTTEEKTKEEKKKSADIKNQDLDATPLSDVPSL